MWRVKFTELTYLDATDSVLNCIYSLIISIWTTFFVESWKKKETFLAIRWHMVDFSETAFDRKEFKASINVDL